MEVGQDARDFDAVRDVGVAVAAGLAGVCLLAEAVGAREQGRVEALGERVGREVPPGNDVGEDGRSQGAAQGSGPADSAPVFVISPDARGGSSGALD